MRHTTPNQTHRMPRMSPRAPRGNDPGSRRPYFTTLTRRFFSRGKSSIHDLTMQVLCSIPRAPYSDPMIANFKSPVHSLNFSTTCQCLLNPLSLCWLSLRMPPVEPGRKLQACTPHEMAIPPPFCLTVMSSLPGEKTTIKLLPAQKFTVRRLIDGPWKDISM